jgi:adenosylcobinamide-GDP ribazoletransferase
VRGVGLATAMRTLTRFRIFGPDAKDECTSLYWFPAVGGLFGVFSYLVSLLPLPVSPKAVLVVIVGAWASRGFHYDGLSDTADGFGGGWNKERRLAIMKDSHVGSFGMLSLILSLLFLVSCYANLLSNVWVLFAIPMFGRNAEVMLAVPLPYAREAGTAGNLVRTAKTRHLVVSLLFCILFAFFSRRREILFALCASLATTAILGVCSKRLIGGVTGDVLGCSEVLAECATALTALLYEGIGGFV